MSAQPVSPQPVGVASASRALGYREFLRSIRTPGVVIQSVIFPSLLLMIFLAVFAGSISAFDDQPYVQRITPALVISGAAFGSVGTISGYFSDARSGFFARLRTIPIGRGPRAGLLAPLLARAMSEVARVAIATVLVTAVGMAFGFRFEAGVWRTVLYFVLATVYGSCFCWFGFSLASRGGSMEAVIPPISGLFLLLLFFSEGVVPREAFPDWAQPIVAVAPTSTMVVSLQRLSSGGPYLGYMLGALAWTVGITAICASATMSNLAKSHRPD